MASKKTPKKSTSVKASQPKRTPKKPWTGTVPDSGIMSGPTIQHQQGFTVDGKPFYPGNRGL